MGVILIRVCIQTPRLRWSLCAHWRRRVNSGVQFVWNYDVDLHRDVWQAVLVRTAWDLASVDSRRDVLSNTQVTGGTSYDTLRHSTITKSIKASTLSEGRALSPRRSPGEGHIFKRASDDRWVGGIEIPTTDGTRKQKRVTAKNRNDVVRKLRELRTSIDAGVIPGTGAIKVGVYLDEWLTKVHKYRCKPSSYPGNVRTVNLYVTPLIGGQRLDRLTPHDVRTMVETLRKSSNDKALKAYKILTVALDQAVKDGLILRNPAAAVDRPKVKPTIHAAFTPEEALHIMAIAETYCDETWSARWAAGFMTGLRESELLGLEWNRVDLEKNSLSITWQLQQLMMSHGCGEPMDGKFPCKKTMPSFCPQAHWDFPPDFAPDSDYRLCEGTSVWTRPKTQRSDRGVPIIAPLRLHLERLQGLSSPNPHNLVFRHPDGTPITQSVDQRNWRNLLKAAGVEHKRQHTLRRTCATLLRAAQVDEQTRMALFGHATADVQRIYAGSTWEIERDSMEKLTDFYTPKDLDG